MPFLTHAGANKPWFYITKEIAEAGKAKKIEECSTFLC